MTGDQIGECPHHPRLHLQERLAVRKSEAGGVSLHDRPLRLLARAVELQARPRSDVDLEQAALGAHAQPARASDRGRRLAGTLER